MNDQVLDVPECYLEPIKQILGSSFVETNVLKKPGLPIFFFLFNLILPITCKKLSKKVYDKTFSEADILF